MNRISLPLVAVFIVFIISGWDFFTRITVESNLSNKEQQIKVIGYKPEIELSSNQVAKIINLYKKFDQKEKKPEPKNQVTKNDNKKVNLKDIQENQKGKVKTLFANNHRYTLKGIFFKNEKFAVLIEHNLKDKTTKELRVRLNQKLGNFKITLIEPEKIKFSNNNQSVELTLF